MPLVLSLLLVGLTSGGCGAKENLRTASADFWEAVGQTLGGALAEAMAATSFGEDDVARLIGCRDGICTPAPYPVGSEVHGTLFSEVPFDSVTVSESNAVADVIVSEITMETLDDESAYYEANVTFEVIAEGSVVFELFAGEVRVDRIVAETVASE